MSFIPRMTLTGGMIPVRAYAITATQEWDVGDVLVLDAAGALGEAASATVDVLGAAITATGNVTTGQSDADELRPYLAALVTGKHEPCAIFMNFVLFETDDYNDEGAAEVADIGTRADLELVSADWGINLGTSATGSTPQFALMDIIRKSLTYLVAPDMTTVADVFQWYDGAV